MSNDTFKAPFTRHQTTSILKNWLSSHQSLDDAAIRRLWILTVLRLLISLCLTLGIAWLGRFGIRDTSMVSPALLASVYFLSACAALWTLQFSQLHWRAQLYGQLIIDLVLLSLIVHVLGGGIGGYAMLLMFPIAAAASLLNWPFALFTAAVTALALLLDGFWRQNVLMIAVDWGVIGVHGAFGFALATLLRYAADRSEKASLLSRAALAQSALADALQEHTFSPSAPGVVVLSQTYEVLTINNAARLLALQARVLLESGVILKQFPALSCWQQACASSHEISCAWPPNAPQDTLFIRATTLPDIAHHTMLVMELNSRREADAQAQNLAGMGRLTASIAHEIRNPLAAISHAGQLLQESNTLDPTDRELVDLMLDNSLRIERIVNDVLNWSRALRVQPSAFDAIQHLQQIHEKLCLHQPQLKQVQLPVPRVSQKVLFDSTHFEQIVSNLLSNAWQALSLANDQSPAVAGHIALQVHERSYGLLLAVLDTAPAVDAKVKAHLFEPFQTSHVKGTGLGLFLAREYARANHGDLRLIEAGDGQQGGYSLLPKPYTKAFVLTLPWSHDDAQPQTLASTSNKSNKETA